MIKGDYFKEDFGEKCYDAVISCQTMHHFSYEEKIGLYTRIHRALCEGAPYIECDYMVLDQKEEDFYFAEYARIRKEENIPEGHFYHYDTPCTVENQKKMFLKAGFKRIEEVERKGNTTTIVAIK